MQLVEVIVAATVFTAASGSSLHLFAQAASRSHATEARQQQLERIELDRLQLQAHWRQKLAEQMLCSSSSEQLQALAAALPPPPQLHREVSASDPGDGLRVRWRLTGEAAVVRERLVTPAGLGLGCIAGPPLTDRELEGVP
jgi:type II secretory pathway component PulJ